MNTNTNTSTHRHTHAVCVPNTHIHPVIIFTYFCIVTFLDSRFFPVYWYCLHKHHYHISKMISQEKSKQSFVDIKIPTELNNFDTFK